MRSSNKTLSMLVQVQSWTLRLILLDLVALTAVHSHCRGAMVIQLSLGGNGLTASQQNAFMSAKAFWENLLVGYQPGITLGGISIAGSSSFIDGPGGMVGEAAPQVTTAQAGYVLTVSGTMAFDTEDLAFLEDNNILLDVLKHEMAHVLGFGILWPQNQVSVFGSGQYLGTRGLAAYQSEFIGQANASFVPVELGGGGGTANFHWDEVDFGAGLTGRTTLEGRDMRDELMSGWLNRSLPSFVSRTTLGQFEDLGFVANVSSVPEPNSGLLFGLGWCCLFSRKRNRA